MVKVLLVVIIFSVSLFASAKQPKYGWIDMQRSLVSVQEGKKILKKLEQEVAENKKSLDKEQMDFQKKRDEFEKKSLVMNEKTKRDKQMELQGSFLKLQEKISKLQQEIQMKQAQASQKIIKKIADVVQDYATKNGYSYIFEKNALIFKPQGEDITNEVIALYDKKNK